MSAGFLGAIAGGIGKGAEQMRAEKMRMLELDRAEALTREGWGRQDAQFNKQYALQEAAHKEGIRQFDETKGQGKVTDAMANYKYMVDSGTHPKEALQRAFGKGDSNDQDKNFWDLYNVNLDTSKNSLGMDTPELTAERQQAAYQTTVEQTGYDPVKSRAPATGDAAAPSSATDSTVPASDTAVSTALPPGVTEADAIQTATELLKAGKSKAAVRAKLQAWGIDPTKVPGL